MTANKSELYRDLTEQLAALLAGESDLIANAANTAALVYHGLPDLNWAGFYFLNGAELVLGPFQGKPRLRADPGRQGCLRHRRRPRRDGAGARRPRLSGPHRLRSRFALRARRAADRGWCYLGRA